MVTADQVRHLAATMRSSSVAGLRASCGLTPLDALLTSLEVSGEASAIVLGGEVAAIWGVRATDTGPARLWMMTGNAVDRHKVSFARACRRELRGVLQRYPGVRCEIDASDEALARLVRWLGFAVEEPRPYGALQMPFCRIETRRQHV